MADRQTRLKIRTLQVCNRANNDDYMTSLHLYPALQPVLQITYAHVSAKSGEVISRVVESRPYSWRCRCEISSSDHGATLAVRS